MQQSPSVVYKLLGGEFGGLSFKAARITNLEVSGGVSGEVIIAIETNAEVSLAVSSASDYTIGETITQAVSGATGTVIGYPEGNDVTFVGSVSGTFNSTNTVTGSTSGAVKIPSNVITPRYPNVYDSTIDGVKGNLNDGVILMDIGGSMRDTEVKNLSCEASPGTTAYYFRNLTWSTGRPRITLPDIGGQMAYFSATRVSKSNRAQLFLDGITLYPSETTPDTAGGVMALADVTNWNPGGIGSGDGGKGLFVRMFNAWRRVNVLTLVTVGDMTSISSSLNTSGKFLGKQVTVSTTGRMYTSLGASASSAWHPVSQADALSDIAPA